MIQSNQKTSLLVPYQLPKFIAEDPNYSVFVLFLQAYYEWMEQENNVLDYTKSLLTYMDVDTTTQEFLNYFINDFMSYFPPDILADQTKVLKIAKQLYQSKGTPASYKFLFRVLFDSDFDYFVTGDTVLKASAGTWYVPKSVRLETIDPNFLYINNLRLFGQTSKSIATVENSIRSGTKTEVFISNIERLFQSGETITVVDSANQPIYFLNGQQVPAGTLNAETLSAKIVGQISQININPIYRGTLYQPGDPVIVYNGLNSNTPNPIGATAVVGTTTTGSIQNINVLNGGYGYTFSPNTKINIANAPGANAIIGNLNPAANGVSNVTYFAIDSIANKHSITIGATAYNFANLTSANANTSLANALTFLSFTTYPISSVTLLNGGGGISTPPLVTAIAGQPSDSLDTSNNGPALLASAGILAPIQIISGGVGYQNNDTILIKGGGGYGAHANVLSVNATGAIQTVGYVYPNPDSPHHYPLGGLGYSASVTPNVTVVSANNQASNAVLYIPGILGSGATFTTVTSRVGSISTINIINPGEDYVSAPNVSLSVQDIVVSNVSIANLPKTGDIAFQGSNVSTALYKATVNNITLLVPNADPTQSLYNLRVFNYTSSPGPGKTINILGKNIHLASQNVAYNPYYNSHGVRTYGDGLAQATTKFLNGLVVGAGQYLNTSGQASSYDVLQSSKYNNFTYEITVEKEIAKYRDVLLNLLHPAGMQVLGRFAIKSNANFNTTATEALYHGYPLPHYTGTNGSGATMSANFTSLSSNTVTFTNLAGADISTFIFSNQVGYANSIIQIETPHGPNVRSEVWSINLAKDDLLTESGSEDLKIEFGAEDLLTETTSLNLKESYWLTFPNVATVTANYGSNTINIVTLTGSYDIVNDGAYSNTMYPLMDIVYSGDLVQVNNTVYTVSSVNYINGTITVANNFTSNANGFLSVNRTLTATDGQVVIYGPIGLAYTPELTTENDQILTTETGTILILN